MQEREEFDPIVRESLALLMDKIENNETIKEYRRIAEKVKMHEGLQYLIEEIKRNQKEAVSFAHYGKKEAEKLAIKKADQLTREFEEHPLVITYREQLVEANDLLQYMMAQLNQKINKGLEEHYLTKLKEKEKKRKREM